jgi:hypothetical protein
MKLLKKRIIDPLIEILETILDALWWMFCN